MKKHFWSIIIAGLVAIITAIGSLINHTPPSTPTVKSVDTLTVKFLEAIKLDTTLQISNNQIKSN